MNTVKMVVSFPLGKVKADCAQYVVFLKMHWRLKKSIIRSYVRVCGVVLQLMIYCPGEFFISAFEGG